jgi:HK97 family phage major capsid protein
MAQSARDYLEGERNAKLDAAQAIVDKADAEKRSLAVEETDQIKALTEEAEEIGLRIKKFDEDAKIKSGLDEMRGSVQAPGERAKRHARSIGEAFVESDAYKLLVEQGGLKSANWRTGPVEVPFGWKEAVPAEVLETANSGDAVIAQVRPGIQALPMERLTVADLMLSGTTNSNSVLTIVEEGGSAGSVNAADTVTETALKPISRLRLEEVPEAVRKIATILPVSDEMLEDVPALRSFIDGRLRAYIQRAEEDQLLNGSGTPPDLSGILDRAIQTATQASLAGNAHEAVFEAITAIRNVFAEPSGAVINSTDWAFIRLAKDLNEQYYGGGPFTGAYGNSPVAANSLWGIPVVVTSAIASGTILVGAFSTQAQVFRRSGLTVEASNSHDDYFRRNLTAIRAEERLALAVYQPDAFFAITSVEEAS